MLALIAATDYRTYAVTLITPARPSRRRIREVGDILSTVSFFRPAGARKAKPKPRPQGATGASGATGPTGATGATGGAAAQGATALQGATG